MKTETSKTDTTDKTDSKANGQSAQTQQAKHPFPGFDAKNPFAAFDPMAYWTASQQLFASTMADAQARMSSTFADTQARMSSFMEKMSALDPNPYFASFRDAMMQATSRASAAAESGTAQYAALENQLIERAHAAVTTWAQLAHDAITYGAQLSTEARKLGSEAARKMGAQA